MIVFTLDDTEYRFDDNDLDVDDAIAIEDAFGLTIRGFLIGIAMSSGKSLKAMVWLVKKRAGEAVRLQDVTFNAGHMLSNLRREEPEGDASDPTVDRETTPGSDNGTTLGDAEPSTSESSPTT